MFIPFRKTCKKAPVSFWNRNGLSKAWHANQPKAPSFQAERVLVTRSQCTLFPRGKLHSMQESKNSYNENKPEDSAHSQDLLGTLSSHRTSTLPPEPPHGAQQPTREDGQGFLTRFIPRVVAKSLWLVQFFTEQSCVAH